MPNTRETYTPYIGAFSSIESVNESPTQGSPFGTNVGIHPGDLGKRAVIMPSGGGVASEYQKVQLDSGAVSANTVGVVASGQLAYWKNKSTYTVTNDWRVALGGQGANSQFRNEVAGIFTTAVTAGNQTWVKQKGNFATVALVSSSPNVGDVLVSDTTANKAQGAVVTAGTAPTVVSLGRFAASGSSVTSGSVDLDIPGIP